VSESSILAESSNLTINLTSILSDDEARFFRREFSALAANVEQAILGKPDVIKLALVTLFAEGHLLLEDRPGSGKTVLAKSIASSIEGAWSRVQFTPDLLPADITGSTIYNQSNGTFDFHHGPVFANVVLGDEINRASPKTQSALLEVMEERQVTIDGTTYPVPRPFMVVATQNPIEFEGTYRLPEAQLDRFLMRLSLGYLDRQREIDVMKHHGRGNATSIAVSPVTSGDTVRHLIALAERVHVETELQGYVADIAHATRDDAQVQLGASTRACLALQKAARAHAAADGRAYVRADDIKVLAPYVLAHRLILTPDAELRGTTGTEIVQRALDDITPPVLR
jgi:MoxR-like ATPase